MEYNFRDVEAKWQQYWRQHQTYKTATDTSLPKYYVLDMFPYPSGAGLHVGHPLGYIASDIYSRYKRLKGFNVLHPMGYDAFGLPAEQYAIQTGQHPAITTEQNINRYREQLDKIGLGFDWSREVRTCDPSYYKWTQWIFMQLFNSWYNNKADKAENIDELIKAFQQNGNKDINATNSQETIFSANEWNGYSEKQQQTILLNYRLAYLADTWVNWCPGLGTVLANEEVKDGVSERGGYPVERKLMKQWCLRITAYAERLLNDLDGIDWTESIKEAQRNWIGRSEGAMMEFRIQNSELKIEVFTTRPDTIFGVTFLTLAPEHELVDKITTPEQRKEVEEYVAYAKNRSERDRMSDVKKISGTFTGAYALHPFTNEKIPVWIGDYVLSGYGTGAVMAVPAGDQRDWDFAKHFNLPIPPIVKDVDISKAADPTKDGIMINSGFLDGMTGHQAIKAAIAAIEKKGIGKGKVNYRLRDAIFSRQRYWGEPFPIYYKDDMPYLVDEQDLPVVLPEVDKYLPTEDGEPPLARAKDWKYRPGKSLIPGPSSIEKGEGKHFWETARVKNWEAAKTNSRLLRKENTIAEDLLWQELRNNKLEVKFRRQHVIDEFIVDFVCLEKMLVIEVDGEIHNEQIEYDEQRTLTLNKKGFDVIRFKNEEVTGDIIKVIQKIKEELLKHKSLQPKPSEEPDSFSPLPGRGVRGEADSLPFELSTMPGWAGSSWYYLRYMDSNNDEAFASKEAVDYWQDVDLYMGGAEHATGHLLYVRFWTKFLYDLGCIPKNEPAKKLINQGMIQGVSMLHKEIRVEAKLKEAYDKREKLLRIKINGVFLLDIFIPKRDDWTGYNIYCSNPCNLEFVFVDKETSQEIPTSITQGHSNANFVKEITVNTEVKYSHTLKDKWLKIEPRYRPIIITDFPFNAFWHYENQEWRDFNDVRIKNQDEPLWLAKPEVEKMSKSKLNVFTPVGFNYFLSERDEQELAFYFEGESLKRAKTERWESGIIDNNGADTFRMYEMFLGPLEQSKPWNTNGISGVANFIRKLWRLYHNKELQFSVSNDEASAAELKVLHKTIKKVEEDVERFSFNTSVSTFMICINELTDLKCNKRAILEPLAVILSPYAPHVAEELWSLLGHNESITKAAFPEWKESFLTEDSYEYPVSVNGKMRFKINLSLNLSSEEVEQSVLSAEEMNKYLNGNKPKKVIVVPGRIVNIVV